MAREEVKPRKLDLQDRDFLLALCGEAEKLADDVTNENWKRAYRDLAYAANVLDAHEARSGGINMED